MNSRGLLEWIENKYNQLFILLFLLLISVSLPETHLVTKLTILILFLGAMTSVIRRINPGRWWLKIYTGLVLTNLMVLGLQIISILSRHTWNYEQIPMRLVLLTVISLSIMLIQRSAFSTQQVTGDTLKGGIAVYVLLGIAWAIFYEIIYALNPGSFNGINPSQAQADLLHFSFITLTTVGYGDIHPVLTAARVATTMEAISGVMYPAILISRLVSLYKPDA